MEIRTGEMRKHRCGHGGPVPEFMGRGASRVRRIEKHFAALCPACGRTRLLLAAMALTDIHGQPAPVGHQWAWYLRHSTKIPKEEVR